MCLAVPGRIVELMEDKILGTRLGKVDFQGSLLEVDLTLVPECKKGDWILVHAGYAIQQLSEEDVKIIWKALEIKSPTYSPFEIEPK